MQSNRCQGMSVCYDVKTEEEDDDDDEEQD